MLNTMFVLNTDILQSKLFDASQDNQSFITSVLEETKLKQKKRTRSIIKRKMCS